MAEELIVCNASRVYPDSYWEDYIPIMQKQIDRDVVPAWGTGVTALSLRFMSMNQISEIPATSWVAFINRHSNDAGALGWHDYKRNTPYCRIFAGDCKLLGLDPRVTLGHEIIEMMGDPTIRKVWLIPDGQYAGDYAAYELCDAVESDAQAYVIDNQPCTNFVTPEYFARGTGPFDYEHLLSGPCPDLTQGGYMSIANPQTGWTQISADKTPDGLLSRRAAMQSWRRITRRVTPFDFSALEIVS